MHGGSDCLGENGLSAKATRTATGPLHHIFISLYLTQPEEGQVGHTHTISSNIGVIMVIVVDADESSNTPGRGGFPHCRIFCSINGPLQI